jgi:hypothetical protein
MAPGPPRHFPRRSPLAVVKEYIANQKRPGPWRFLPALNGRDSSLESLTTRGAGR